jgi:sec-independent protein translocase protein TatC
VAVFLMFLFAAFVTPTPDPFGMIALAVPMCALYFAAVGVAFLNDRRRAKAALASGGGALADDETSPLDHRLDEIEPAAPIDDRYNSDDLR